MLSHTRAMINQTINEIKFTGRALSIITQIIYISYLIYALVCNIGLAVINSTVLAISVLYLAFYIIYLTKEDKQSNQLKHQVRHLSTRLKLCLTSITLITTIYGIIIAADNASAITVLFAAITTVGWILSLLTEILVSYFNFKKELFLAAIDADMAPVMAVVKTVGKSVDVVKDVVSTTVKTAGTIVGLAVGATGEAATHAQSRIGRFFEARRKRKEERKAARAKAADENRSIRGSEDEPLSKTAEEIVDNITADDSASNPQGENEQP